MEPIYRTECIFSTCGANGDRSVVSEFPLSTVKRFIDAIRTGSALGSKIGYIVSALSHEFSAAPRNQKRLAGMNAPKERVGVISLG